jgi:hypothetical protein
MAFLHLQQRSTPPGALTNIAAIDSNVALLLKVLQWTGEQATMVMRRKF